MACRKMNEDFAYASNTESGCNVLSILFFQYLVVYFSLSESTATTKSAPMKCKLVRIAWASISGSVAEWSKALV